MVPRDEELDPAFLRRTAVATAMTGVLAGLVAWAYKGPLQGGALAAGAILGAANLWILWMLIRALVAPVRGSARSILSALALKVVGIYGAGAALLIWGRLPAAWFLIGFSVLFVVLVLRVLGRWLAAGREGAGS